MREARCTGCGVSFRPRQATYRCCSPVCSKRVYNRERQAARALEVTGVRLADAEGDAKAVRRAVAELNDGASLSMLEERFPARVISAARALARPARRG